MTDRRRRTALVAALLAGAAGAFSCYRPRMVDCVLACQSNDGCPSQMACSAGLCTRGTTCAVTVAAGEAHTCATIAGKLKCWGANASAQLGIDDLAPRGDNHGEMGDLLPAVDLGTDPSLAASTPERPTLALGSGHTCVVLSDGRLRCWGDNRFGQLGLGDDRLQISAHDASQVAAGVQLGSPVLSVAAGLYHTCALFEGGSVKCWGDNRFGQLGLGVGGNRGGAGDAMGDTLPAVDLGAGAIVTSVVAGAYHTCALLQDGSVRCWGWNQFGQLGVGDQRDRGLAPSDMGAALPPAGAGADRMAAAIAAGAFHTCAMVNGGVGCWGLNKAGQLGLGDDKPRGNDTLTIGEGLALVDLGDEGPVQAITAGADHTCALLRTFAVRCWGFNHHGELGIGDTENRCDYATEKADRLPDVALGGAAALATSLSAGAQHTCAVVAGVVRCWGRNVLGRLGVGDNLNRGDGNRPVGVVHLVGDSD